MAKKEDKITSTKKVEKKNKKNSKKTIEKKPSFLKQTREEMKKVSWPTGKDVIKYSIATIVFCLIIGGFFQLLNLGLSFIKGMFA